MKLINTNKSNRKSTIKIWKSIKTYEDKKWTKKYHDPNPKKKSFGAKVIVTLNNGKKVTEELDRADAHPYGSRPFKRDNYINKFLTLTKNSVFFAGFFCNSILIFSLISSSFRILGSRSSISFADFL